MELFKTVPAYSRLFIYFRKYWDLRNTKITEKFSRRHLINSSDVFVIKGFTVLNTQWPLVENSKLRILSFKIVNIII